MSRKTKKKVYIYLAKVLRIHPRLEADNCIPYAYYQRLCPEDTIVYRDIH